MSELIKHWDDGGVLSYERGEGSALISSDVNEGVDRETSVTFITDDRTASVERVVKQVGRRERFNAADGRFILANGGLLNTLKMTYEPIEFATFNDDRLYDTGILITNEMTIEVKFQRQGDVSGGQYLYGVVTSPHSASVTAYLSSGGAWRWGAYSVSHTCLNDSVHEAVVKAGSVTFDGTKKTMSNKAFTTPYNLVLGGVRQASGSLAAQYVGRVFYFRIKKGDEVLLDWQPVRRNDGTEGFIDSVTGKFFQSIV